MSRDWFQVARSNGQQDGRRGKPCRAYWRGPLALEYQEGHRLGCEERVKNARARGYHDAMAYRPARCPEALQSEKEQYRQGYENGVRRRRLDVPD